MNIIIKNALESIDKMDRPNLDLLIQSEEYHTLNIYSDQYLTCEKMLKNKEVTVFGDVRQIIISGINKVILKITYSLYFDILYKEQTHLFEISDDDMKKYVRANLFPTTGIELIAKFTGKSPLNSEHRCPFEVVKINKINQNLNFGYYICAGDNPDEESGADACHHNWGYNTNTFDKDHCWLCGSKLKYVDNMYNEFSSEECI